MHFNKSKFLLAICVAFTAGTASAQTYPDRPIRLVVGYPPGGPVDFVARAIQFSMGEALGQPIVIENKSGAGGNIGADSVFRSKPDGYNLLLIYERHALTNIFYKNVKFNAIESFDYLSLIGYSPLVVLASKKSGLASLEQFEKQAKSNPGKFNFATTGPGVAETLKSEVLQQALGTSATYIPFNGTGGAMNAIVSGQVDLSTTSLASAISMIKADKVTPLVVGTQEPIKMLPNVPPLGKYAKNVELTAWVGLIGPKGMPLDTKLKIQSAVNHALADPSVRATLEGSGFVIQGQGPQQALARAKSDYDNALKLIKERNLKVE